MNRLIVGIEGIGQELLSAIASLDQLHHGDGRDGGRDDQFHHGLGIADVGIFDVEAGGLQGAEELLDGPPHAVKINDSARLAEVATSCVVRSRQWIGSPSLGGTETSRTSTSVTFNGLWQVDAQQTSVCTA